MNNMKQRLTGKILSMLFLLFAIGWTTSANAVATVTKDGTDLKISFEAAGDFCALVENKDYNYSLPSDYGGATKIIFDGPELNSKDVAQFYRLGDEKDKDKVIDLRSVKTITTEYSTGLNVGNNLTPDIWFPNGFGLDDLKSYFPNFWNSHNFISLSSDGSIVNIVGSNKSLNPTTSSLLKDNTSSLVYYSTSTPTKEIFESFDIKGIKNLVLSYADFTISNSDNFADFKNIARVILPSGATEIKSFTASANSSVAIYQLGYRPYGSSTITKEQINVVKPGGLSGLAHYTNEAIVNAPCIDVLGAVNYDDFSFFSGINNKRINLSQMTFDPKDKNLDTEAEKKAAIDQISNLVLEYIALPDVGQETTDPLFKNLYDKNPNLKGVAYYYKTGKSYSCKTLVPGSISILTAMTSSVTGSNLNIDSIKVSGSLNAKDISNYGDNPAGKIYFVDGHFVFDDELDASNQDGVRKFKTPQPEGAETVGAFSGSNGMIKVDLSDATFSKVDDATLSATNLIAERTTDVVIPTDKTFTKLPVDFLHVSGTKIETICIPYNITHIGLRAFYGLTNLSKVTTTTEDGTVLDYGYDYQYELQDVTNEVTNTTYKDQVKTDNIDYSAGSIVFSKNLKEIDSYAFSSVEKIKDVYCLSKEAPICQVNAFGTKPCTGNNGFSPYAGITRQDFRNQNYWIVMLHYPDEIVGTDLEKRYKDVTRDYTITDAEGHTDGFGNVIHWPNHDEFFRSFNEGTNGFLWNAWDSRRGNWSNRGTYPLLSGNPTDMPSSQKVANSFYEKNPASKDIKGKAFFYHTGYTETVDGTTTTVKDLDGGIWADVPNTTPNYNDKLYNADYRGWHQFVLSASVHYTDNKPDSIPAHDFSKINDNGWWTICVPFDMNKKEVREMFGLDGTHGGPHVCELTSVERTDPTGDAKNGKIKLNFDRDVYNYVYADGETKSQTLTTDESIVIHAGVPYLLQPDFNVNDDGTLVNPFTPGKQVLRDKRCAAVEAKDLRNNVKSKVVTVPAVDAEGKSVDGYNYSFIGNFWQTEMPKYAYFLAWFTPTLDEYKAAMGTDDGYTEGMGYATFFWQKEMPAQTLNWNPYTAIIGCNWKKEDQVIYVPTESGTSNMGNIHWYTRHNNGATTENQKVSVFGFDGWGNSEEGAYTPAKGNSPLNISISIGGCTPDGITKVHFGTGTMELFNGKVYNLNGQYVGDSLENLPKGIYIAGGKKYVVK